MTKLYIPIIVVLAILLTIVSIKSCVSVREIVTIQHDTTTRVVFTPMQQASLPAKIQYIPKFFNGSEHIIYDTIYRDGKPLQITPESYCEESLSFLASSDTLITKKGDTLTAKFHYPQRVFDFDLHFKPDSIQVITNTITKTMNEAKFKLCVGIGAVATSEGNIRAGGFIGLGYTIF